MQKLQELFLSELGDIYNAEKQLTKALPRMAKAANSESLRAAFEAHLEETEQQIERAEEVFAAFDKPAKGKKCKAMEGLIAEAQEIMSEFKGESNLDAALICAAQKVEHYEIATYGCLCTWAELLGNKQALRLLKETMNEEEQTDQKLSDLAESCINEATEDSEEEEPMERSAASKRATSLRVASRR
jgi:ferritin-like metal-binding protein YciE